MTSLNRGDSSPTPFSARGEDVSRFALERRIPPLSPAGAALTTLRLGVQSVRETLPTLEERQAQLRTRLEEARANPVAVEVRQDETLLRTEEAGEDGSPFDEGREGRPTFFGEGAREVGDVRANPRGVTGLVPPQGTPDLNAGASNPADADFFQGGEARPAFANERASDAFAPGGPAQAPSQFQGSATTFTTFASPDVAGIASQGLRPRLDVTV